MDLGTICYLYSSCTWTLYNILQNRIFCDKTENFIPVFDKTQNLRTHNSKEQ